MNIKDIQEEKQKLESDIAEMINNFLKKYELFLEDIDVISNFVRTTTNGISQSDLNIYLKIRL